MTRVKALWIVGEPGVGKTTLARGLLGPNVERGAFDGGEYWTFAPEIAAVGLYDGNPFDGGDRVPPSKIVRALDYGRQVLTTRARNPVILLEGDKFACKRAFDAFADVERYCVLLVGSGVAKKRRAARASVTGKIQNESWVTGRRTKSSRFAYDHFYGEPGRVLVLHVDVHSTEDLAERVRGLVGLRKAAA